jgi:uncharacterized protein (DUF58 family)
MLVTPRFLWLLSLGALPLLAAYAAPPLGSLTALWNLALATLAVIDFLRCPKPVDALEATRATDDVLSVATENDVRVRVRNRTNRPLQVVLRDEPPPEFALTGVRQKEIALKPREEFTLSYLLTPPARGDFRFGDIYARIIGPLGLVIRQGRLDGGAAPVAVFPNIKQIGEYELNLRRTQRARMGVRRLRLTGGGREFSSLRDYTPDDEFRVIDWKATARRGKTTARTFEAERAQDVLLLIDKGRLMRQEIGYVQKLDTVINAAMMLAHVVVNADDRVGLLLFDDEARTWVPPHKGKSQTTHLLHALYAVHADPVESDYRTAFRHLAARWRKRSLIVLFTDLADPETSAMLLSEIAHLNRAHLVCCVTVRDPLLSEQARQFPDRIEHVFEKTVAAETLAERKKTLSLLERQGVLVVDAEPKQLSVELVARYLAVKQQAIL